uniref:Uncharacterized protein n=1 Tax=Pyxicephalus adspersus TaxID=30357 RepID=A0AAV3AWB5_PYXAD|nr:TPA: hypothetical protein GDO54_007808 [Pyxicephalus adspersus]
MYIYTHQTFSHYASPVNSISCSEGNPTECNGMLSLKDMFGLKNEMTNYYYGRMALMNIEGVGGASGFPSQPCTLHRCDVTTTR